MRLKYIIFSLSLCLLADTTVLQSNALYAATTQKKSSSTPKNTRAAKNASATRKSATANDQSKSTKGADKRASNKKSRSTNTRRERSSSDVRREQAVTTRDIKETSAKLDENKRNTAQQLNRLGDLRVRMTEQSHVIQVNRQEANSLQGRIVTVSDSVRALQQSVENLKKSYAATLKRFQGTERMTDKLSFIFAAESFNEALARFRYMRQINQWRKRKSEELHQATLKLNTQQTELKSLLQQKESNLVRLNIAQAQMKRDTEETDRIVTELKREGSNLQSHLARQQQRLSALDRELDRIITLEQERQRRAEEARRKRQAELEAQRKREQERRKQQELASKQSSAKKQSARPSSSKTKPAPAPQAEERESAPITASIKPSAFAAMRGRLPFPLEGRYRVVSAFGRHPHPDIPSVEVDNPGIDIELLSGSGRVRAVAEGTVSAVFRQPGYNNIVMVRHGEYLTIYAGVDDLAVATGQTVSAGQTIGRVQQDSENDGRRRLHFEVRREREKLNPMSWLR